MKNAIVLLIKFAATFLVAWISFSLFDNVFLTLILIITGLVAVLNYFIGDLLILPRVGNIIASLIDGVLAATTAYLVLVISNYNAAISLFIYAVMIAAVEFIFHIYMLKTNMIKNKNSNVRIANGSKLGYSTETAKEIHPYGDIWKPSNRSSDHDL